MRNVIILCDGMSDYKIESLGNKTPMMVANKPNMDELAKQAFQGLARTLYDDLPTGSDVANLSVLGYDPHECYTGRSPMEALGLNIPLCDEDTIFRLNLVTISTDDVAFEDKTVLDHSGSKISSEEAFELLDAVKAEFSTNDISFYPGVSYRHIMIWKNVNYDYTMIPPHDILGEKIKGYVPQGTYAPQVLDMMKRSYDILMKHPVNIARMEKGLKPANCIWLWGEGKKPKLGNFKEKYGKNGAVITGVPLIKGIGRGIGFDVIEVPGATGDFDTNYKGKGEAAYKALINNDTQFLFIHIEAPDECGHEGDVDLKIKSIENIDKYIVPPVKKALDELGKHYKILIMPDHATPIEKRTHTLDPVPFLIYDNEYLIEGSNRFDEDQAKSTGLFYENAYDIMTYFRTQILD